MSRSQTECHKQILGRIQRLCCLGVGSEMIMQDLMRDVLRLCAAQDGVFCWSGPGGATSDFYATFATASELEFYFREFDAPKRGRELFKQVALTKTWPLPGPVVRWDDLLAVDRSTWLRSDYYNLLWRPYGLYQSLGLGIPTSELLRHMLFVFRDAMRAPFGPREVALLAHIGNFLSHSFTPAPIEGSYGEGEDRALFIVDRGGKIVHAPLQAQMLLSRVLVPRLSPAVDWRALREPSHIVVVLCNALAATAEGRIGQQPPVSRLRNPWGEFVLRAYWLGPTNGAEQTRHIGITIERNVASLLVLYRRLEHLPLTGREKQACLLMARGLSGRELAEAMGIASNTAITHQRSLYAKLGVRNRVGLFNALQSA